MMNLRAKTIRRLILLIGIACVIIGLGTAVILFRLHQRDVGLAALREQGLTSFEKGDYPAAMKALSKYLSPQQNQSDAEALLAYAESRSRIEEPDHKEIGEAIVAFRRYLDLKPGDLKAQRLLMDLYMKSGRYTDANRLADDMLVKHPQDLEALRGKANALLSLRQYDDALKTADAVTKLDPKDLKGQLIALRAMAGLDRPVSAMLQRTQSMRAEYPDDPRFEMLEGFVHAYDLRQQTPGSPAWTKARDEAKQWLLKAAAHPVDEVDFIRQLVAEMDNLNLYADAQKLLESTAKTTQDPKIKRLLVERLYQNNRFDALVEYLKSLDPASDNASSDLLAFKALALEAMNQQDAARQISEALAKRVNDEIAVSWTTTLRTIQAKESLDAHTAIDNLRAALVRDPQNSVARFYLGSTYARLGEDALALQQWQQAASISGGWYRPYYAMSRALLAQDRILEALQAARFAYQCLPNGTAVITNLLVCQYRANNPDDLKANTQLLEDVEKFRKVAPKDMETLPVYAGLLARTGKSKEAADIIRQAMRDDPAPDAAILLQLVQVSRQAKLGLEQTLVEYSQKSHGTTPLLALAQAAMLNDQGKPQEGLQFIRQAAGGHADSMEWRMAVARYMESIDDAGAADAWMQLADDPKNADNLDVQLSAMDAQSIWSILEDGDPGIPAARVQQARNFLKETIDRVQKLTSDNAIAWRLANARWLLADGDKSKDSAEAIVRLTDIVKSTPHMIKARRLLAKGLAQVGQINGAVEQLQYVVQANPQSARTQIELAGLLLKQGKTDDARRHLETAADSPQITTPLRIRAATMLSSSGNIQPAIDMLKKTPAGIQRDLMLASLYKYQGQMDAAENIYKSFDLLHSAKPNPSVLQAAANFEADRGNMPLALQYMDRLSQTPLTAPQRGVVLAAFMEKHGTPEEALSQYEKAAQASPDTALVWQALAGYQLRNGRYAEAADAAGKGLQAVKDDAGLKVLQSVSRQAAATAKAAEYKPLLDALSQNPQDELASAAWDTVWENLQKGADDDQTFKKLEAMVQEHPSYLPLQSVVINWYTAGGNAAAAKETVARLMDLFPNSAVVAEQAVRVYAASQDWQQMLIAAQQWRNRSLNDPVRPDLAIAEAQCFLGNPAAAVRRLQPYLQQATAAPQKHANILVDYTRALVLSGQSGQAAQLLQPLLKTPFWRMHWLSLASLGARTPGQITQWIETLAPYIDAKNPNETVLVAKTWYDVARLKGVADGYQRAMQLLTPLADSPDMPAAGLIVLGSAAERADSLPQAVAAFQKLLTLKSASASERAMANNELAWILYTTHGDLHQALTLSEEAVKLAPREATYQDTLGRIYLRQGDKTRAIDHLQQSARLDAGNVDTLLTLGLTLCQAGKPQEAARIVTQIDQLQAQRTAEQDAQLAQLRKESTTPPGGA